MQTLIATASLLLLIVSVSAHEPHKIVCNHDEVQTKPEIFDVDEDNLPQEGRILSTDTTYPNIRIYPDLTYLNGTAAFNTYVTEQLIPPVISYLQSALKVKYPLTYKLNSSLASICGKATPIALKVGIATDLLLIFSSQNSSGSSWVASATSCMVSSGVNRPIIATIALNSYAITPSTPTSNPLNHEFNVYSLMHEVTHALGFSASLYNYYVDASGITLKNHIKKVLINGSNRTVLDIDPLTSKLRAFHGCSTLQGGIMENDGGSASAGSHWERAYYAWEYMASGAMVGMRISEFTLALLEGSGWYLPDYSYAEPFYTGQGEGCDFINSNGTQASAQFEDFCTGNGRGCTSVGTGGGYCQTVSGSDSRRIVFPTTQTNCENPSGVYYTPFSGAQVYKRGGGSKCFSGNLTTYGSVAQTNYCFSYSCSGSGVNTVLQVNFGKTALTCTAQGPLTVKGYLGALNCPDPLKFCNTIGIAYCPRNCMGRGTCMSNQCVCDLGFEGVDCSFKAASS